MAASDVANYAQETPGPLDARRSTYRYVRGYVMGLGT